MEIQEIQEIDIEIDELANSIKNVISGDIFSTDIIRITKSDLKAVTKKKRLAIWLENRAKISWKRYLQANNCK